MNTEQLKAAVTSEQIDAFKTEFHRLDSSLRTYDDAIKAGLEAALSAQPEQQQDGKPEVVANLPFAILPDELKALQRFHECAMDGEGYDVQEEMMQLLAEIGLLRRKSGNYYEHTTFGLAVLNGEFSDDQKEQPPASAQAMTDAQINELGVEHGVVPEGYWSEDAIAFARALLSSNVQPSVNAEVRRQALEEAAKWCESQKYMELQPWKTYSSRDICDAQRSALTGAAKAIRSLIDQPVRGKS